MINKLTEFSDTFSFQLSIHEDPRGLFVKTYHQEKFRQLGLNTNWREQYISVSQKGVLRGLHFQTPPEDHAKMVICLGGSVRDVVVDLRKSSPFFGEHCVYPLQTWQGVYLPRGFAHGFSVPSSDSATLLYMTSTEHSPRHDSGLLWSGLGIDWGLDEPLLSPRDKSFQSFSDFDSPF